MDYIDHIQMAIVYIEDNLKNKINLTDCAKVSGYSDYHFLRIFKESTGITPGKYIKRRRISEVAKLIMIDHSYMFKAAYEYGFNSYENFLRAFKNEHHVTPIEYKLNDNSLHLYNKIDLYKLRDERNNLSPKPRIIQLAPIHLYGYLHKSSFKTSLKDVPTFWNRYNCGRLGEKLLPQADNTRRYDYGVAIVNHENESFEYFIGVESCENIPNTDHITLPAGTYVSFTTPTADSFTFVDTIHRTWKYINEWFRTSDYIKLKGYEFERYCEKSYTYSEEILIPVKKKER
ncbi:AraC family transcriptional regulator [Oceanirhabdus seepicola]|uniref:AraC family transcriptional regulator n=1 Tax=Oceanirhabdus seepicola TaxID=2828781 RepID=A0A9J6P5B7_9CLOT|nr:helix-turn-helix domain-containing protein [Oceanirhabdus seepicola]MCM1991444.1 AraC family transcriptional regulator [Oceanirhabdus seepicola]